MDKIIKLNSRGANNYLKQLKSTSDKESTTYILISDMSGIRFGRTNDNEVFVDPAGGPMIVVGKSLKEIPDKIVSSIDSIKDTGFIITFK